MTHKHTALPWELWGETQHHGFYIEDGVGNTICDFYYKSGSRRKPNIHRHINAKANAEFIARACNSHYELLEALKYTYQILKKSGIGTAHLEPAQAAIKKAKGES